MSNMEVHQVWALFETNGVGYLQKLLAVCETRDQCLALDKHQILQQRGVFTRMEQVDALLIQGE